MSERDVSPAAESTPACRGRWNATGLLLGMLGDAGGALVGWVTARPMYQCEGIVYIAPNMPTPQDPAGVNVLPFFNGFVAYQVQLLESIHVANLAVATTPWQKSGEGATAEVAQRFFDRRSIVHKPDTQHILVRFTDPSPDVALAGVRALLDAYSMLTAEESAKDDRLTLVSTQADVLAAQRKDGEAKLNERVAAFGGIEGLELRHKATVDRLLAAEAAQEKLPRTPVEHLDSLRQESVRLGQVRVEVSGLRAESEDLGRRLEQMRALKEQLSAQLVGKGRISISHSGTRPQSPIESDWARRAAVGAAVGASLGVGFAALWFLRRRTPARPAA